MKTKRFTLIIVLFVFLVNTVGCGMVQVQPTATAMPTNTPTVIPTLVPTETPVPLPTVTSTPVPTKVYLPDISGVVVEYGLVPYTGDFTCVAPDCEEYADQSTGLLMQMFSDGSGFKITLGWPIDNKLWLFKKVITKLYPDMAAEIIKAIPTTGKSGDFIFANGSDQIYNWDVSGVWYMAIFVHIAPK